MKACDWEAHKDFILELHIKKKQPLRRVRDILERERGVQAGYEMRIQNIDSVLTLPQDSPIPLSYLAMGI
jgi:hypothetical protein